MEKGSSYILIVALMVGYLGASEVNAVNPGLKLRITQTGLNYAVNTAVKSLAKSMVGKVGIFFLNCFFFYFSLTYTFSPFSHL